MVSLSLNIRLPASHSYAPKVFEDSKDMIVDSSIRPDKVSNRISSLPRSDKSRSSIISVHISFSDHYTRPNLSSIPQSIRSPPSTVRLNTVSVVANTNLPCRRPCKRRGKATFEYLRFTTLFSRRLERAKHVFSSLCRYASAPTQKKTSTYQLPSQPKSPFPCTHPLRILS